MDTSDFGIEKVKVSRTTAAVPEALNRDSRPSIATHSASHNWWETATRYGRYGAMGGAILGALLRFRSKGNIRDTALCMFEALSDYHGGIALIEGTASMVGFLIPTSAAARAAVALAVMLGSAAPALNKISANQGAKRTATAVSR